MAMTRKKWVFWDCDDTLVNSEVIAMGVAIHLLADETQAQRPDVVINEPQRHQLIRDYAGWHFDKMIEAFQNEHGVSFDHAEITERKTKMTLQGLNSVEPIDHIETALTELSMDHHFALVTSSEFSRVNLCLDVTGIGDFFPINKRYSGHDSLTPSCHKPLPDIYLFAMEDQNVDPSDVVTIEDSASGVKSGVDAGIPVIGFVATRRVNSEDERAILAQKLLDAGAQFVVSDARDLSAAARLLLHGTNFMPHYGQIWNSVQNSIDDGGKLSSGISTPTP